MSRLDALIVGIIDNDQGPLIRSLVRAFHRINPYPSDKFYKSLMCNG